MSHAHTCLISGCSGGLGRSLAEELLECGHNVVVTARDRDVIEDFEIRNPALAMSLALDVTDNRQIAEVLARAEERFGAVDFLINNAAFTVSGAIEETTAVEYRPMFDANLFGAIELMRSVLPGMRKRRAGHIVNIGSIAAISGVAGFGYYGASKAALALISEALANEVSPLGIKVTIVDLGGHNTASIQKTRYARQSIADYTGTVAAIQNAIKAISLDTLGDARLAAKAIVSAVMEETPPQRMPIGVDTVQQIEATLARRKEELDRWRDLAESSARHMFKQQTVS